MSHSNPRRRRLDATVAALQQRHGATSIRRGAGALARSPALSTGFPALDVLTGCQGVPLGALTLLSGRSSSGKMTLAYLCTVSAQAHGGTAALLDLAHTANPDYLQRCGVALDRLLIARPQQPADAVSLLLDLVHSAQVRLVLLDGLPALRADRAGGRAGETVRRFEANLPRLRQQARAAGCAVLLLDEPAPPWQRALALDASAPVRRHCALHLELRHEQWLYAADGELTGYQARATLLASRWRPDHPSASVAITFNGTVRARESW